MAFFTQAVNVLKILVMAVGAGLGAWGVINLMEGYGNDNPGANAHVRQRSNKKTKQGQPPAAIPSKRDTVSFCNFFVKSIENYNAECYNVLEQ